MQDGAAYAHLLNALAPELESTTALETEDPTERANLILQQAEKMDCKRYVTPKDIVEGSTNLNIAFVAEIFQNRSVILIIYHGVYTVSIYRIIYRFRLVIIFTETRQMLPTNKSSHCI